MNTGEFLVGPICLIVIDIICFLVMFNPGALFMNCGHKSEWGVPKYKKGDWKGIVGLLGINFLFFFALWLHAFLKLR